MLLSNDWLRTLDRADVSLVDSGLVSVTEGGVVDGHGVEHKVDTIVFATGFTPTEPPVAHLITGKRGETLAAHSNGSPNAYKGTAVSGFPNLFLMYGPNTNLGHSSIVYMLESQAEYVNDALNTMKREQLDALDVNESVQVHYNKGIQHELQHTVWNKAGGSVRVGTSIRRGATRCSGRRSHSNSVRCWSISIVRTTPLARSKASRHDHDALRRGGNRIGIRWQCRRSSPDGEGLPCRGARSRSTVCRRRVAPKRVGGCESTCGRRGSDVMGFSVSTFFRTYS